MRARWGLRPLGGMASERDIERVDVSASGTRRGGCGTKPDARVIGVMRLPVLDREAQLRVGLLEQLRGRLEVELLVGEAHHLGLQVDRLAGGDRLAVDREGEPV